MISYFLAGLFAYYFLNYKELFESEPFSHFMKPVDSKAVAAGPALQAVRGVVFSIALWPFRKAFLEVDYGWFKLWVLIVGLSILSTVGAAPGSIEGFIYTTIPVEKQVMGYLEVLPQTLAFSLMVFYWYRSPRKAWNWLSVIIVVLIILMSILALIIPVQ